MARWVALVAALGLVGVGSGASAPVGGAVAPGGVLDQSNAYRPTPCRYTGWGPDNPAEWAAQTFTAGVTGTLTDAVLRLRVVAPRLTLALDQVDASGQPLLASSLATTTL